MKIGKHKKGQGSLWGFLAVNYIAFTLLLLTVASLGVLGASLYTRAKAPFPDAEELVFVFYPRKIEDVEFVEQNFVSTLYKIDKPITADIERKIRIEFIDNREISPVDLGRK